MLEMCEERRFWNLLQDLIQNFCFVKIHYDVNFGGLAHEVILMLEVLCSNFFKLSMMNGSGTLTNANCSSKAVSIMYVSNFNLVIIINNIWFATLDGIYMIG